jgi:hypothetical protein
MSDMRKTPSYLKGLAETRARVAAEVLRYRKLQDEIGVALATAQAELDACDRLIRKFDERLNPDLIEPIKAWKGRYGARGNLRQALLDILKEKAPSALSTVELGIELQLRLELDFITSQERGKWLQNSVTRRLRVLVLEGLAERLHDLNINTFGYWRWKGEGCESLRDLAELAKSSGVTTHSSSEHYELEDELATDDLPV